MRKQKWILNKITRQVKLIYTSIFIILSYSIFAHDRLAFDEFNYDEYGCVIKSNGDSVFGFFNVATIFNSSKIIIKLYDEKKVKIPAKEVKFIISGNNVFKNFNDFSFLGKIIDTNKTIKLYEAYSRELKGPVGYAPQYLFINSYIIKPGKLSAEVIYEKRSIKNGWTNYNEQLKQIFLSNREVIKYMNSLDKISFDDIPSVIAQINTLYK